MDLLAKSDKELLQIANPIYDELVQACNNKDLKGFSKYMPEEVVTPDHEQDVMEQWENVPFLTKLDPNKEFMGILRRGDTVLFTFKQESTIDEKQYLGLLFLQSRQDEIKVTGMMIK